MTLGCLAGAHAVCGRVRGVLLPVEEVRALRLLLPADAAGPQEVRPGRNHVRAAGPQGLGADGAGEASHPGGDPCSPSQCPLPTGMQTRTWTVVTLMALAAPTLRCPCLPLLTAWAPSQTPWHRCRRVRAWGPCLGGAPPHGTPPGLLGTEERASGSCCHSSPQGVSWGFTRDRTWGVTGVSHGVSREVSHARRVTSLWAVHVE